MRYCSSCGSRFSNDARYCPVDGQPTTELVEQAAPAADPLLGALIDGRYRIDRAIGEGGMGVVYQATHVALQKRFALKVLRGEMARDQEVVQRFVQEAQASSSIGHANIIDISDFGRLPDGTFYFVMEYLDGESLTDLIARSGGLTPQQAVPIIEQMASALSAAHESGIVHRDLKPDNVFLVRRGSARDFVKILDFGIAKVGGAASKLTRTGMIFGTPHYMSPEQAAGQAVDKRTDIYALGVIMYEMVTGKVPFDADTFMGILSKHMFEPPRPPTELAGHGDLGALEPVILKALVKKPEQRYQTMDELLRDLAALKAGARVEGPARTVAPVPVGLGPALERTGVPVASEAVPYRSSGRGALLVAGGLLLAGVAIGAAVHFLGSSGTSSSATLTAPVVPSVPSVPMPQAGLGVPTIGAAPSSGSPSVAVGVAPPTRSATIRIESTPSGAGVYVDDSIVGETPLELPRPTQGENSLEVRLSGYRSRTLTVAADSASPQTVVLERSATVAAAGTAHAAPHPRGPATIVREVTPQATSAARTNSGPPHHAATDVLDPWQ